MQTSSVRGVIAISVVCTTCVVIAVLTIFHAVFGPDEGSYADMMKTWGSVMSGTLGTILGYYFGKSESSEAVENANGDSGSNNTSSSSSALDN